MSDLVEIFGLGSIVEGINLLLGRGPAFVAAGIALMFIGAGLDDQAVTTSVRSVAALPLRGYQRARHSLSARKARRAASKDSRLPAVRA